MKQDVWANYKFECDLNQMRWDEISSSLVIPMYYTLLSTDDSTCCIEKKKCNTEIGELRGDNCILLARRP